MLGSTNGDDTVGQILRGRDQTAADHHRGGHDAGHAFRAGPVPVRAAALDAGQVHLSAAGAQEERERRQRQREPQQLPADHSHMFFVFHMARVFHLNTLKIFCIEQSPS